MLKKLIILFDQKNEQFIRQTYLQDLQTLQAEMAAHSVSVVWNFVRQDPDNEMVHDVDESDVYEKSDDKKSAANKITSDINTGVASCKEPTLDDILADKTIPDSLYIVDNSANLDVLKLWGFYVIALIHTANQDIKFKNARYAIEGLDGLDYTYLKQVYQRLAGLPWEILETERLKVRESTLEDVEDFYRIYKEPSITYYMENLFEDSDQEYAYIKDYIRYVYGLYGYGMWTVILKETDEVIGRAGISIRDGYDVPELGFVIETVHQRKGYASEVCRAILDYASEELQMESVQALVCAANEASIEVLSKLGFIYCKDVNEEGKDFQLWMKYLAQKSR